MEWYESRVHTGLLKYAQERNWVLHAEPHTVKTMTNIAVDGIVLSQGNKAELAKWVETTILLL